MFNVLNIKVTVNTIISYYWIYVFIVFEFITMELQAQNLKYHP